jgi:NADP-dependent 3-hydroxy acid dehydrogenase YdfG
MGIGETLLVAAITGAVGSIGNAFGFKYRLNGMNKGVERIETKLDKACETLERHSVEIAEIKTNCAAVQFAKKGKK